MEKFDPLEFGFVKLGLQNGSLCFYEYQSGDFCDGTMDRYRINVYLSQDGDFITVWHGLFDPAFIDQDHLDFLEKLGLGDFDFSANYDTPLLRAYIENNEQADVILKSLRFEKMLPSCIRIDNEQGLICDRLPSYHDEPEEIRRERQAQFEENLQREIDSGTVSGEEVHEWLLSGKDNPFPKA